MREESSGTGKKALALYGSRNDLEHLAGRIKRCVPGGDKLTNEEALSLAQISISTGFDPFIGEIWYISKKGPMIGIRGYRNRAKGQSNYSLEFRPMTPAEIAEHDIRTDMGDVGYICELYRHDTLQEAVAINQAIGESFIPIKPIIGTGIWRTKYEKIYQYKDDTIPHGKSAAWVAKKRAEADALNRGFDISSLPYGDMVGMQISVANGDDIIEAEVIQREVVANAEESKGAADHANDLFGEQSLDEIEHVQPPFGSGAVGKSPEPTEDPIEETLPGSVVGPAEVAAPVEDPVEETFSEPVTGPEEVVTPEPEEETMMGPLETIRRYAGAYSKRDADLAPTGAQLKLLGALCIALEELGMPKQPLFTLREMIWGEENFTRSQFQAMLQYVCATDLVGGIRKNESGGFMINEGVVEKLTPLLGAEIPAGGDLPF